MELYEPTSTQCNVVKTRSAEATRALGKRYAGTLSGGACVALVGDLGTGKTTFVQGLAQGLGIKTLVSSPSFLILQEYVGRLLLFHLDAYRLHSADELFEIGFEDYLDAGGLVVVEWGEKVRDALPPTCHWITFETCADRARKITSSSGW